MQNEFGTTFLPTSKYMFGTFHQWEFKLKCFYFLCYFIIQVQSYNLNREQYRRKVALEIWNKKGKLSNLGFLNKKEPGTFYVYKKKEKYNINNVG